MSSETSSARLSSVILRATLALIFIWHGMDKLTGPHSAWGASWADRLWRQEAEPPADLLTKLENLPHRAWLTDPEHDAKLTDEEIYRLANERFALTHERIQRAYSSNSPPLPAVFSAAVQYAVTWGELLGGFALLIGLLTRFAALGLILIQMGAIYFVTSPLGLSQARAAGFEYNLCLVAMCLVVAIQGGGGWSLDHFLHWGRDTTKTPESAPTRISA